MWVSKEVAEIKKQSKAGEKGVGLFGGTFNPIHFGHLRGVEEIRESFGLREVIFIPAAMPPHKAAASVLEARHRLEMVKRATYSNPYFSTTDIELQRHGKSYSIDTIRYLLGKYTEDLYFILGGDAFGEIETWKEFQQLFSLCNFIVMIRPESQTTLLNGQLQQTLMSVFRYEPEIKAWTHASGHTLYFKEIAYLDISSTQIRELIGKGRSVRYLIPAEVEAYIAQHKLYHIKG